MLEKARKELYKGQTNCAYWHGVFGGIYLHHLRSAVYEHLINADKILNENFSEIKEIDFYGEGKKAAILENRDFFICADPRTGGVIRELDYKPKSVNFINTLARRRESYHKKIWERINNDIKEPLKIYEAIRNVDNRIRNGIFYDNNLRACLIDRFIEKDLSMEDFSKCNYIDMGDFSSAPYDIEIKEGKIELSCNGRIKGDDFFIKKDIRIAKANTIEILYTLKNKSSHKINTLFGTEFNISMPCADSENYSYVSDTSSFSIKDSAGESGMKFMFSTSIEKVWHFPVMTVSQSERAYRLSYQAYCIFPIWKIELESREESRVVIHFSVA